jgi:hypothetical protein
VINVSKKVSLLALLISMLFVQPTFADSTVSDLGSKPYMGWSSWSEQQFYYANIEPKDQHPAYMDWLTAAHVEAQSDILHRLLQKHGYTYINLDAGWWSGYDSNGRPLPDSVRFPKGVKDVAAYVHAKGQKIGVYYVPGIDDTVLKADPQIAGTPYHIHDIIFSPVRPANGWNGSAKIDYSKPGAQEYINSIAAELADWGVDFLKLDGVTPNGDNNGTTADGRPDVAAWRKALDQTHRPIWLELSWNLNHDYAAYWQEYAYGRRITGDVESYGTTYTNWNAIRSRFDAASRWSGDAGVGKGWNDLDSLDLVNSAAEGINDVEKRTYMTLWSISCSPLYIGGDLLAIDPVGLSILTNDEVIAVDQAGRPAERITGGQQQIWRVQNADGSETVGLFNLDDNNKATVSVTWSELGISGPAKVRDLWQHADLGVQADGYSVELAPHACSLLKITPVKRN